MKKWSIKERASWWIFGGNRGLSSDCLWSHMMSARSTKKDHPYDSSDFGRCYHLIRFIPEWKKKLDKMRTVSPVWNGIVDNWDQLSQWYEEGKQAEIYSLLYTLRNGRD